MDEFTIIQKVAVWAIPVLLAITLHEAAHGFVAARLGDKTAQMLGRVTLNPIKHIDPIGTVLVPLVMLLLPGGFLFGWAKPVPVNMRNLNRPERDMAIVAAAGPLSNLLMGIMWAFVVQLGFTMRTSSAADYAEFVVQMGVAGVLINVILLVINLIPFPPLDGSRILRPLLQGGARRSFDSLEQYGIIIVLLLFVSGVLTPILSPILQAVQGFVFGFAGL